MADSDGIAASSPSGQGETLSAAGRPIQISLGKLLPLIATFAILVSIYHTMGLDNGVWHFAFGLWLFAALLYVTGGARAGEWTTVVAVILILLLLLSGQHPFIVVMFSFLVQIVLVVLLATTRGLWIGLGKSRFHRWIIAVLSLAIGFGLWTLIPNRELNWVLAMRRTFPIADLSPQLAFEKPAHADAPPNLQPDAAARLDQLESLLDWPVNDFNAPWYSSVGAIADRNSLLKQIHNDTYLRFVRSEGFGATRAVRLRWRATPERLLVPTPEQFQSEEQDPDSALPFPVESVYPYPPNVSEELIQSRRQLGLQEMHFFDVVDFVNPAGWGWTPEFRKSSGFVPHAFYVKPSVTQNEGTVYELTNLQLVTIDRFDEPRAFVLDDLPRMDKIRGDIVPTRLLDDFEIRGIAALQSGEELAIEARSPELSMVGAIRATKQCLQCHDAARGELLGAFTYHFLAAPSELPLVEAAERQHLAVGAAYGDDTQKK